MSLPDEPGEVPLIRRALLTLLAITFIFLMAVTVFRLFDGAIEYLFPEPADAYAPERIVLCGKIGRYRIYCGVGDGLTGPTEDPVRQWR